MKKTDEFGRVLGIRAKVIVSEKSSLEFLRDYKKIEVRLLEGFASASISQDKKVLGLKVSQKRLDRIDNALFCRCIWHDLFYLF